MRRHSVTWYTVLVLSIPMCTLHAKLHEHFMKALNIKPEFTNNIEITNALNTFFSKNSLVVVAFVSNDCAACKAFEASKAFSVLARQFPKVEFVIVSNNNAEEKELARILKEKYKAVDGYPLFMIVKNTGDEPLAIIKGFDNDFQSKMSQKIAQALLAVRT